MRKEWCRELMRLMILYLMLCVCLGLSHSCHKVMANKCGVNSWALTCI